MEKEQVANLVRKAQNGDRQAFALLYRQTIGQIFAYFFMRLRARADAEDLTTEVFMKAYKNISKFELRSSFNTWLYSITKNAFIDFIRSRRRPISYDDSQFKSTEKETEIIQAEKQAKVDKLLRRLSEKHSQVLRLRFLQNLSVAETAQTLGISESNVKVRQLRALE